MATESIQSTRNVSDYPARFLLPAIENAHMSLRPYNDLPRYR